MRSTGPRIVVPFVLATLSWASLNDAANSCGFDSPLGNSFSAMHPRSIAVAFAIGDAVNAGVLGHAVLSPIVPGAAGYWRAVGRLQRLQRLLSVTANHTSAPSSISVLFIDSNLWSRFSLTDEGFHVTAHTAGPGPGDAVIVTSEAILAAVIDDRLPITAALDRGLIAIDGAKERKAAARRFLTAALTLRLDPDLRTEDTQVPSVRLFGPARPVGPK